MNAEQLLALAERVEQASGPDRELDAIVAASLRLCPDYQWASSYPAWEGRADGRVYLERGGPSFAAPTYTASIDAAMTLVPDGCEWLRWSTGSMVVALPLQLGDAEKAWARTIEAVGATPALALTAAALRARAALTPGATS